MAEAFFLTCSGSIFVSSRLMLSQSALPIPRAYPSIWARNCVNVMVFTNFLDLPSSGCVGQFAPTEQNAPFRLYVYVFAHADKRVGVGKTVAIAA